MWGVEKIESLASKVYYLRAKPIDIDEKFKEGWYSLGR